MYVGGEEIRLVDSPIGQKSHHPLLVYWHGKVQRFLMEPLGGKKLSNEWWLA